MNRRDFCRIASLAALGATLKAGGSVLEGRDPAKGLPKCRVTVLRRHCFPDLQSRYLDEPETGCCELFTEGQEFTVRDSAVAPEGFCPLAWECIKTHVASVLDGRQPQECGLSLPDDRAVIACCNDGTRPVIFKIQPA